MCEQVILKESQGNVPLFTLLGRNNLGIELDVAFKADLCLF